MIPLLTRWGRPLLAAVLLASIRRSALAQTTDPGLLLHFGVSVGSFENGVATDASGKVTARIKGHPQKQTLGPSEGYRFNGTNEWLVVADDYATNQLAMPTHELTASAWVNLAETIQRGSIMSCVQDNDGAQLG